MESFLQIFGELTIGWAAAVISTIIFFVACYNKAKKYFSDKAIIEKEKNDKIQKLVEQVEKYPKWHQESLNVRDDLTNSIDSLKDKFENVIDELSTLKRTVGDNNATTCRYRIIRFDDEIRHDEKHSKEHFDQIIEDIDNYEEYCNSHPEYRNNKAELAMKNIKRTYQKCEDNQSFL